MPNFIFTCIDGDDITTKEFQTEYLYDVIEHFEYFLKGSGYVFDGTLDIVEDNTESECEQYCEKIYESPDKGETIYQRDFGGTEKTLYSQSYNFSVK